MQPRHKIQKLTDFLLQERHNADSIRPACHVFVSFDAALQHKMSHCIFLPVTQAKLKKRQSSHRSRIGAQNPRSK